MLQIYKASQTPSYSYPVILIWRIDCMFLKWHESNAGSSRLISIRCAFSSSLLIVPYGVWNPIHALVDTSLSRPSAKIHIFKCIHLQAATWFPYTPIIVNDKSITMVTSWCHCTLRALLTHCLLNLQLLLTLRGHVFWLCQFKAYLSHYGL